MQTVDVLGFRVHGQVIHYPDPDIQNAHQYQILVYQYTTLGILGGAKFQGLRILSFSRFFGRVGRCSHSR